MGSHVLFAYITAHSLKKKRSSRNNGANKAKIYMIDHNSLYKKCMAYSLRHIPAISDYLAVVLLFFHCSQLSAPVTAKISFHFCRKSTCFHDGYIVLCSSRRRRRHAISRASQHPHYTVNSAVRR